MSATLADRLAEYSTNLKFADLPPAAIHETKRRIIDSLACGLGALDAEPCVIARRVASGISTSPGSTLWGTRHQPSPDWAAFANGLLVRYFDFNDTYLSKEPAHPSDNIPAALAVAESCSSSGADLISAIILAYEVQCRLCDAASLRKSGWDHVTYGAFSTALASCHLMRLDATRTRHAVGIAGVASAALRQSRAGELSHWKAAAFANAARHGVFAAMLARQGMTGPHPIFEGLFGFQKLVSGPLDLHRFFDPQPMILQTSIKFWPAEYHSQSAIQAALELHPQIQNLGDIQSVIIESHDAAVDIIGSSPEQWRPPTRETADHSLPYIVAVALADGQITAEQFSPARFTDAKILEFLKTVRVQRNAELSALYPNAVANIVTVNFKDGRKISRRVDFPIGSSRNPMSDAAVEAKFHSLADPVLGSAAGDRVLQYVWKLNEAPNVADLPALLLRP